MPVNISSLESFELEGKTIKLSDSWVYQNPNLEPLTSWVPITNAHR